jgi:parallel beta-helix repeat protein
MRTLAVILVLCGAGFFLAWGKSEAKTYRVPGDYDQVQAAVEEASYGDSVLVSPGKYRVQARLRSGVVVKSTAGPDSTVLWNNRWHVFELIDCDMLTAVSGFAFEGKGCNVCVVCTTGAPVVENNLIRQSWDGISLYKSNALIKNNTVVGCTRGLFVDESDPEVADNVFRNNADGISLISSAPVISRCTFDHNGRAILIQGHSYPTIGGSLASANKFINNAYSVYNSGYRIEGTELTNLPEVAVATYNYWGSLCPDRNRMRGQVVIKPWTNAEADSTYEVCPQGEEEKPVREGRSR